MKGLAPLFLGIFGTFVFSWVGLTVIPNWQIGHLEPQSDEEGTDVYPMPQSGMVERGARVYAANGCIYCHSQQVRADYAAADIERGWGDRRSAPRDYIFERPVLLGKMRMGQDLANIGARAPSEQESPPPGGAASPAASPAAQQGAPTSTSPAPTGASPSPATAASPSGAGSPPPPQGAAVSSPPASPPPPPATSPSAASSPAITPAASPAPKAPTTPVPGAPPVSPSPATAPVSAGASPASSAPWPEITAGEPALYSAAWHHVHLYSPRSINVDSDMPSYRFLYQTRRISDAPSADALHLTGSDAPSEGWEVVPTFDAKCLVAYLMSLNQSHPLKEVRSPTVIGARPTITSPAAAPASSPAPAK
jgi:cbb3-type cytochrome oxidase cytochrome c subunit